MRYLFAFSLILVCLSSFGQRRNPVIIEFEAEKLYNQGLQLYQNRDYSGAIDYFNQVLQTNPDHPEVYELRGEAYFQLANFAQAIRDYREAINRDPNNAELYNSAGVAAAKTRQINLAVAYFEQALAVNPNHEGARRNLATAKRGVVTTSSDTVPPDTLKFPNPPINIMDLRAERVGDRSSDLGSRGPIVARGERDFAIKKEYRYTAPRSMTIGGVSDPNVQITQVKVDRDQTWVMLEIENIAKEPFIFKLPLYGDDAFFLASQNLDQTYKLKAILGARDSTFTRELAPREKTRVTLVFEPIAPDLFHFHLLEGRDTRAGAWNFWNITLKN